MVHGIDLFISLFKNLAIFIALVAVYRIIFGQFGKSPRFVRQLLPGMIFGLFAIICMNAKIPVFEGGVVDQRNAIVALSGTFGGPVSAVISALFAASYRIYIGGAGVFAGVVGISLSVVAGIALHFVKNGFATIKRAATSSLFAVIVILPGLLFVGDLDSGWKLMKAMSLPYGLAIFCGIFIVGFLLTKEEESYYIEQSFREGEKRYRELVEGTGELIIHFDSNAIITYANHVSDSIFGLTPSQCVGQSAFRFVHPDDYDRTVEWVRECIGRGVRQAVIENRQVNATTGETRTIQWSSSFYYDASGKVTGVGCFARDITEQRLTEKALADTLRDFQTLFEEAQDSILFMKEGRIVDCNHSATALIGLRKEDIIGTTPADFSPPFQPDGTDSFNAQERIIKKSMTGTKLRFDWMFINAEGSPINVEVSLQSKSPETPDILLVMARDVTEQRRAEQLLRQSEEKFSRLFKLSPDTIVLSDLDSGIILDVNDNFLQQTGYSREEAIGSTPRELNIVADDFKREILLRSLKTHGQVRNLELEIKRKDGSFGLNSMSAQKIEIEGRPFILSVHRDITETKKIHEMMVQTEKMISVGGIAAGIAHEINNPLGIVLQAAQNLAKRIRPDFPKNLEAAGKIGLDMNLLDKYMRARKLDSFIEDIRSAALRASNIIRHLLDFSRRSESSRAACDLPGIVRKALALAQSDYDLKKRYDFRQIHIDLEVDDDLPVIHCTETEIEQVFLNLLRNSAQAMASADPPIESPRISIRLSTIPDGVRIEMDDNGPGMLPEVRHRAFEPFYTTKEPGQGTGLGLSVSYFIITKGHEGRMKVESEAGQGCRFTIELPTEEARCRLSQDDGETCSG